MYLTPIGYTCNLYLSTSFFLKEKYEQGRSAPSFSTYQEAASYLKGKGLSSGGLMTASEWARHRSNPADTSGAASYPSYQAYLQGYVNALLTS